MPLLYRYLYRVRPLGLPNLQKARSELMRVALVAQHMSMCALARSSNKWILRPVPLKWLKILNIRVGPFLYVHKIITLARLTFVRCEQIQIAEHGNQFNQASDWQLSSRSSQTGGR